LIDNHIDRLILLANIVPNGLPVQLIENKGYFKNGTFFFDPKLPIFLTVAYFYRQLQISERV